MNSIIKDANTKLHLATVAKTLRVNQIQRLVIIIQLLVIELDFT